MQAVLTAQVSIFLLFVHLDSPQLWLSYPNTVQNARGVTDGYVFREVVSGGAAMDYPNPHRLLDSFYSGTMAKGEYGLVV